MIITILLVLFFAALFTGLVFFADDKTREKTVIPLGVLGALFLLYLLFSFLPYF